MLGHHHHHHDENDEPEHEHEAAVAGGADMAGKSLADALHVSFKLLSVLMLLLLALYLMTGVAQIRSGEKGVKRVMGKITDVVGPGLGYTWPFPIGQIERISVSPQTVHISDFWMYETPEQKLQPLISRGVTSQGLEPGLDGALMTGDGYFIHVEIECQYQIDDVLAWKKNAEGAGGLVESVVACAAIHSAAVKSADGLMSGPEQEVFKRDIVRDAQAMLDKMDTGVMLTQVNLLRPTWPLRALGEYINAQKAGQEAQVTIDRARTDARQIIEGAAGANYEKLVGEPWLADANLAQKTRIAVGQDYNLIGQYERARRDGNSRQADAILRRIDEVLVSAGTTGQVATMLATAEAHRDAMKRDVSARVERFDSLLPQYLKAPAFLLEREWALTREQILSSAGVEEKWISGLHDQKTILQLNTPPEIVKEQMEAAIKKNAGGEEGHANKTP